MLLISSIFEIKAMAVLMFCHTEVYDAMRTLRVIYWVTIKSHLKNM